MYRLAIVFVLLMAAFMQPRHAPPSPALAAAPHRCYNIQLVIRSYRGSAGAGHVGEMYRMHNLWNGSCTLQGFPGVQLLDAQFHTLPTHLTWGLGYLVGKRPIRLVTLGPHGNAYFVLEWVHIPTGNQPCPRAHYLMIIAPNDHLPVVTYGGIQACGGKVTASPVAGYPFPF